MKIVSLKQAQLKDIFNRSGAISALDFISKAVGVAPELQVKLKEEDRLFYARLVGVRQAALNEDGSILSTSSLFGVGDSYKAATNTLLYGMIDPVIWTDLPNGGLARKDGTGVLFGSLGNPFAFLQFEKK